MTADLGKPPDYYLKRMAITLDPVEAKDKMAEPLGPNICYGRVAMYIAHRQNPSDVIVFYGYQKACIHGILLDSTGKTVADKFSQSGLVTPQGYLTHTGETLKEIFRIPVSKFRQEYFN